MRAPCKGSVVTSLLAFDSDEARSSEHQHTLLPNQSITLTVDVLGPVDE